MSTSTSAIFGRLLRRAVQAIAKFLVVFISLRLFCVSFSLVFFSLVFSFTMVGPVEVQLILQTCIRPTYITLLKMDKMLLYYLTDSPATLSTNAQEKKSGQDLTITSGHKNGLEYVLCSADRQTTVK